MEMDREDLEIFVNSDDVTIECMQITPTGNGRCAILFLISDSDFVETVSVVFEVEDFEPTQAKGVLATDDWLMSLSASPEGELFALEATLWIWRYKGKDWSREKIAKTDLECVWAESSLGPIAAGSDGVALRLIGKKWVKIPSTLSVQYTDVCGSVNHGEFACGELGTIHRITDKGLLPFETHRNDMFNGIDVAADGTVRVAGDNGVCLQIFNEELSELETEDMTYFAVRSFKDKVYWGAEDGLFLQSGLRLEKIGDTGIASDLRSDGNYLYVAGIDTAWRFDGESWKSLRLVYENGFKLV